MARFKTLNPEIEPEIDVNGMTIYRVEKETGIRITDLLDYKSKAYTAVFGDMLKLLEVIYFAVKPDLDKQGKTLDDFFTSMKGDQIVGATEALVAELVNFSHASEREVAQAHLKKHSETWAKLQTAAKQDALRRIEETDYESLLSRPTPSSSSSSLQASAA